MTAVTAPRPRVERIDDLLHQLEQLEGRLEQLRGGLVRSHRLATLGTLTSIIAHEYNNILTPIIGYCQMALSRPADAELRGKALEKALNGAERAAKISASILGFAGEVDQASEASLPGAVRDALACLARHPSQDGIELTVEVPEVKLAISPLNLQQVLLNLILNARKAMKAGSGGKLAISAEVRRGVARVRVTDTGPGIPPQVRGRLFEPFVTAAVGAGEGEDEQGGKGTGLGLFICRDLVQNAGGRIGVDSDSAPGSASGSGASFWFDLPVAG